MVPENKEGTGMDYRVTINNSLKSWREFKKKIGTLEIDDIYG